MSEVYEVDWSKVPADVHEVQVPGLWPNDRYCDDDPCYDYLLPPHARSGDPPEPHWHREMVGYYIESRPRRV